MKLSIIRKRAISKRSAAFILFVVLGLGSCKKNDPTNSASLETPVIYPSKIVYANNILVNGVATPVTTLYTFSYNPSFTLLSIGVRYSGSTADTLYNKIALDASGRLSQFSTPKNSNALHINYDASSNVSSVSQFYLGGGVMTNDTRNFKYAGSQISGSDKFVAGAATASQTNTFTTDENGNITRVVNVNGTTNTTTTYTYSALSNPFYQLKNNAVLAFFPDQLWVPIEVVLFSEKLIKDYTSEGSQTTSFSYQFDKFSRITLITATTPILNSTIPLIQTYTITYTN
jgi:hypothetical protein